jgi:hypothetical protein
MVTTTGWLGRVIGWMSAVVFGLSILGVPDAAAADVCRSIDGHEVCIVTIKRSAKNYWEFNAAVRIDGKRGPKEPYNCRSKYKTNPDGRLERFGKGSIGALVCRAYRPPIRGNVPLELKTEPDDRSSSLR